MSSMEVNFVPRTAEKIQTSILNGFKLGVMNGNPETYQKPAKIEAFKSVIEKCSEIEQDLKFELDVIAKFQCQTVDDFDKEYAQFLRESKRNQPSGKDSDRYQKFVKDLEDIQFASEGNSSMMGPSTAVDADMEVQNVVTRTDPISKKPIQNPVKNNICNHTYDRDSISEAIRMNPRIRCPYMGCSNKKHVTHNDLSEDRDFKRMLLQEQTQTDAIDDSD